MTTHWGKAHSWGRRYGDQCHLTPSISRPTEPSLALVTLPTSADASSPPDCVPQEHFDASLHLETEVFFHGMKGCSRRDTQSTRDNPSTRVAHIIRLQPEPRYRVVLAVAG